MNWVVVRPALKAAIVAATGANCVVWKGAPNEAGWSADGVIVKASISGERSVGNDEERRASYDAVIGKRTMNLCGARQFNVTVRFETQDGTDSGFAMTLASKLRTRIWRTSVLEGLRAVNVSIADVRPTQTFDNVRIQDRVISVAVVELICNGVENDVDDTTGAADWIAQVSATGTLSRGDENDTTVTVPELTKRVQ